MITCFLNCSGFLCVPFCSNLFQNSLHLFFLSLSSFDDCSLRVSKNSSCALSDLSSGFCDLDHFDGLFCFHVFLGFALHTVAWLELSMSSVLTSSSESWCRLSLMLRCELNPFEDFLGFFVFLSFALRTVFWVELSMSSVANFFFSIVFYNFSLYYVVNSLFWVVFFCGNLHLFLRIFLFHMLVYCIGCPHCHYYQD